MFESENMVTVGRARDVDCSDDQFSLVSDVLSCYAATLVWACGLESGPGAWHCREGSAVLARRRRVSRTWSWGSTFVSLMFWRVVKSHRLENKNTRSRSRRNAAALMRNQGSFNAYSCMLVRWEFESRFALSQTSKIRNFWTKSVAKSTFIT